jgi:hypothetical protein
MLGPMACAAQLGSASISPNKPKISTDRWTLKQVQGDEDFTRRGHSGTSIGW